MSRPSLKVATDTGVQSQQTTATTQVVRFNLSQECGKPNSQNLKPFKTDFEHQTNEYDDKLSVVLSEQDEEPL